MRARLAEADEQQQYRDSKLCTERLTIATNNISTIQSRLHRLLVNAVDYRTDILCLQETRLTANSLSSVRARAQRFGYKVLANNFVTDKLKRPMGTNIFLTRWPMTVIRHPNWKHAERVIFAVIHCPNEDPIAVANVHLPHDDYEADKLLQRVRRHLGSIGLRSIIVGDFNQLATGKVVGSTLVEYELADSSEDIKIPTSRPSNGTPGRHIDFLLHTRGVDVKGRSQKQGLADHDYVQYDIATHALEPNFVWKRPGEIRNPAKPPKDRDPEESDADSDGEAEEVHPDAFEDDAAEWYDAFLTAAQDKDTERMWELLSMSAERLLKSDEGRHRHELHQPTKRACRPQARMRGTTEMERLSKLGRVVGEIFQCPADSYARRSAQHLIAELGEAYAHLADLEWFRQENVDIVNKLVEAKELECKGDNLRRWDTRMHDINEAAKWAMQDNTTEMVDAVQGAIHPQLKADQERERLHKLWSAASPDPALVDKYMTWVTPEIMDAAIANPRLDETGERMWKRCRQCKRKAGGVDGWSPAHMWRLPKRWFGALAMIWNVILDGGRLPRIWTQMRVVLIPKNDGSGERRSLGIAALAWRLGTTELSHQMRNWVNTWLDEDMCSGPGRCADELLDRVFEDVETTRANGTDLGSCKIDLSKCFDRCHWERCSKILLAMGLSPAVAAIIRNFYEGLDLWVENAGAVCTKPIRPTTMLVQGCPLSVLMMIADGNAWMKYVKTKVPRIKAGAYFDDRTLWNNDPDCEHIVDQAVKASEHYDKDAKWIWNHKKGQRFASSVSVQQRMEALDTPEVGNFSNSLELLGVEIAMTGEQHRHNRSKAEAKASTQLKRINIIAADGIQRAVIVSCV